MRALASSVETSFAEIINEFVIRLDIIDINYLSPLKISEVLRCTLNIIKDNIQKDREGVIDVC